jgi:hypothetical protein
MISAKIDNNILTLTMLTIKTHLKQTALKGIGLFTSVFISKDMTIWVMDERFHKVFSEKEINEMPALQQEFLMTYGTWGVIKGDPGRFLELDDSRFINHSECPNIKFVGEIGYALRDISIGEELTCDYKTLGDDRERQLKFENLE